MKQLTMFGVLLVLLGLAGMVHAQTNPFDIWGVEDGVRIRQGDHIMWTKSVETRPDGSYAVAWSAATHGSQNVYLQVYDDEGTPQFADGGLRLTGDAWAQERPLLMPYGDGDWIVGWRDYRFGTDKFDPGVLTLQRVNANGELLWPVTGIPVTDERYTCHAQYLLPGENGDFLAVWGSAEMFAMRYTAEGIPVYAEPVNIAVGAYGQVVTDDAGGLWCVVFDSGPDVLQLNRMLADGSLLWPLPGFSISPEGPNEVYPDLLPDGAHGVIVAWNRGYNDETQVYAQRLDADGTPLWGDPYLEIVQDVDVIRDFQLARGDTPAEFYVNWRRDVSGDFPDRICLQKFSNDATAPQALWDVAGLVLDRGFGPTTRRCSLLPDGNGGVFSAMLAYPTDQMDRLHAWVDHIDASGTITWTTSPTWSTVWDCGGIRLFEHDGLPHLYSMEHFPYQDELHLRVMDPASGATLAERSEVAGIGGNIQEPAIQRRGDVTWLSWMDQRPREEGTVMHVQCIDSETGQPYFADNGISLTPYLQDPQYDQYRAWQFSSHLAVTTDHAAIVGWISNTRDADDVQTTVLKVQRVGVDGSLQFGEEGLVLPTPDGYDNDRSQVHHIQPMENGSVLLFLSHGSQGNPDDLWLQKLSATGDLLWGDGIQLTDGYGYMNLHKVVPLPDGLMMVLYSDMVSGDATSVKGLLISSTGEMVWDNPHEIIDFNPLPDHLGRVDAVVIGQYVLVGAKADQYGGGNTDSIYLQGVDLDGYLMFPYGELTFEVNTWVYNGFAISPAGHDSFWYAQQNENQIEVNRFDVNGEPELTESILLAGTNSQLTDIWFAADGNDGVYAIWSTGDNWVQSDLYYTHIQADGRFAFLHTPEGTVLNDAPYEVTELFVTDDQENGFLAVWNDWRGRSGELEGDDVYCIRINEHVDDVTETPTANRALTWSLAPLSPNPFNPSTTVRFTLADRCEARVTVVDVLGRQVATLLHRSLPAGQHQVAWTGQLGSGGAAASGVYFIRLDTPNYSATRKAVLLK